MEQNTQQFARTVRTLDEKKPSSASVSKSKATPPSTAAIIASGRAELTPKQIALLESRGLDVELAVSLGWRSGPKDFIEIPYLRGGVEVNCKSRTLEGDKKFYQRENGEKCFYNVDAITEIGDNALVVTEGEMDCLAALACGFIAVSVPDGAPAKPIGDTKETVKYDYLKDIPTTINKIILAVDSDNAGANLLHDISIRLGKHRCMWVKYPVGCKDLNDALMKYGKKGVLETIARAQFMKVEGLYIMSGLPPKPNMPALDVGILALKDNLRLRQGDLSVVTGIPSMGKTTFTNYVAVNMAARHGWGVCFASFEQVPQTEHKRSLRTLFHGRQAHLQSDDEKTSADEWIDKNFSFIVPDDESTDWFDLTWLTDRMAAAVTRHNAKMIIIDPWNEIDHVFDQREISSTQYIGKSLKHLKRFASRYLVHVQVVAHPAKMQKNKDGTYPVPSAYDIADSAHFYNKPDQVIIVHREADKTLVRISKSKYHYALGKPGDVDLTFDENTYRYA